jgi:hypothetical protein
VSAHPIPPNWPVQPLKPGEVAGVRMTCGACELSWDDSIPTSMTPTPSARCPFENFHITADDWVKRFEAQGIDLDDVIHDHKSREASVINNSGVGAQVEYLLAEYGPDYLQTLLDEEDSP